MKKVVLIIAFIVVPFITMAQDTVVKSKEEIKTEIKADVAIKKVDPISVNPKTQNKDLNYKKSIELISVKAYLKSLHIKRKESVVS
ncbi:hypothetical protein [Pontimicrobium sp. IMCC45349]|jgi:hypothetical protein|uniref:hypothetical protein n=1 Tax=Pontimicrobium sp. IMCC45349 TaxID=3391574 RepID=UPI0039A14E79